MMQQMGMVGEETVTDSNLTWITKTHWPMKGGGFEKFHAQKMIVIVRNPIDVIVSFANLFNTFTHSMVPEQSYSVDLPEFWNKWVPYLAEALS